MKYMKKEYWNMINSENEETRIIGEKKWDEGAAQYSSYFNTIQGELPKRFLTLYKKYHGFHDVGILSINIENIGHSKSEIEIKLENGYIISYKGVVGYTINVPKDKDWISDIMWWGYSEFELLDNKLWENRLLFDLDSTMEIVFKKIMVKKY